MGFFISGTYFYSGSAESFINPYNPDYLSRVWRARQTGSLYLELDSFPTNSVLTVSESLYYYEGER
jgi:hypothetical protein